jgi:hypothetical protein
MEPTGEMEARQTSQYMKGWDYGQYAKKKLNDGECFDREPWRKKKLVFGLRKTVYSQKNAYNIL